MAVGMPPHEQIEAEIRQVRGVLAARVVTANDEVTEIHVLAALGRPVKQVIRDVESVCAARFRLDVDHRRISVAQIDVELGPQARLPRPRLHGIRQETAGDSVTVSVYIACDDQIYSGEAQGASVNTARARLAAMATVRAIASCMEGALTLGLGEVVEFDLAGQRGFTVVVSLLSSHGEERLLGCALTQSDDADACARAVLDGINRRITQPFSEGLSRQERKLAL